MNLSVAIIEPVGGHGGMDYYDFGLCDGLGQAGLDVVLYTCDETSEHSSNKFVCRKPFNKIFGSDPGWLRGVRYVLGLFLTFASSIAERRKIFHFHFFNVGWLQLISVGMARLCMRRVVVTAHDVECFLASLDIPKMNRLGYRMAHRVIAHNHVSCKELVMRLGISESKIDIIPHGNYLHVIGELPSQAFARNILGINEDANVLLFFGQIKEVKGLDVLLRALPAILKIHPDTVLLIAGKPWRIEFEHYKKMMMDLEINECCVSHIRYIKNEEVPLFYSACDVVVLPYQRIYQSGVVLMAMSYAKPVLVSDIEGMLEVVTDEETGFVFRNGDSDDLAQQACRLLANHLLRHQVAINGLELMKKKYDWKVIGEQTAISYQKCFRKNSRTIE